jgi:hypothetical protein
MNKSVIVAAVIVGIAVLGSPFFYDGVKQVQANRLSDKVQEQGERRRAEMHETIATITLMTAAEKFEEANGRCPKDTSELLGEFIAEIPKGGENLRTTGNCKFF